MAATFTNCKKENNSPISESSGGIPDNILVDIPSSISQSLKSSTQVDTGCIPISGDSIYQNIGLFIAFGEYSASFVQDIIKAIKKYELNKPMDVTFVSDEDGKQKHLVVVEGGQLEGINYEMKLTFTDVESNMKAMQVYWNKTQIEGIAIVHPKYFNSADQDMQKASELMYRVEYSSVKTADYDQKMVVAISGYPLSETDQFSIDNLKMMVTKKGDIVTVTGNSNHPNAKFINPSKKGFSYAFAAKADQAKNIGTINLALAPLTETDASVFTNYSVSGVINTELNYFVTTAGQSPDAEPFHSCITSILENCQSPAYYNANGYVSCGTEVPSTADYTETNKLEGLKPFAPADINALDLKFGE